MTAAGPQPPQFDAAFRGQFETLLAWRRDVRRFKTDALADGQLQRLLACAHMAPSVGNSQPWRFVEVADPARRGAVKANFEAENARALACYAEDRAALYARLKLAGLDDAPVQLAVFCEEDTPQGEGLGRRTMPEMLCYSCVCAVNTLWLAARCEGVGVGWVSIIDPKALTEVLDVPSNWKLIAYLCIGYPIEEHLDPELERARWQAREGLRDRVFKR